MAATTRIEWSDATWNPLTGCTSVSPGCDHCYARTLHERFHGRGSFDTVTLAPHRLDQPLRWVTPRKVFVNSTSDLFHSAVPDSYIADVFAVMAHASRHTFQLLTKRHARMRSLLSSPAFGVAVDATATPLGTRGGPPLRGLHPLPYVWVGVSVETQAWADRRVPDLLRTPAAVRFVSCEPLLGPVNLCDCDPAGTAHGRGGRLRAVDWVIAGGESGVGARLMHPDWARSLRDQCDTAGVPFLFKQWGAHDENGRRMSKSAAGRRLDGVLRDAYPDRCSA